ncbi:MAG TPA: carbohydrate ABC transporter permease [Anaerolineales bacterium]|nr:carbohydrate ABC transporter permease [Anaerolineales bacterium]
MAITRTEKSVPKPEAIGRPAVRTIKWKNVLGKAVVYLLLTIGAITFIAPWAWMVSASFQPLRDIFEWPPNWVPDTFTLQNYTRFLTAEGFFRWVLNSGFLAIIVLLVQMFFNSLAAYSFAKRKFPGRDALFLLMLGTLMIPGQLFLIPNYLILLRTPLFGGNNLVGMGGNGMLDSFWGIIVPYSFSVWSVFFMRQYMKSIPDDLIDAARMDGASEFTIYSKVIMPLCGPVLAAQAIFTFTFVWNDFFWPLIVIDSAELRTLQLGLALFIIKNKTVWDIVFAGSVISTLPVLLVFIFFQKYFIRGIALTGMK